jgi:hypothetical protein
MAVHYQSKERKHAFHEEVWRQGAPPMEPLEVTLWFWKLLYPTNMNPTAMPSANTDLSSIQSANIRTCDYSDTINLKSFRKDAMLHVTPSSAQLFNSVAHIL